MSKMSNFIKAFKSETFRNAECHCGKDYYATDRFYDNEDSDDPADDIENYVKQNPGTENVDVEVEIIRFEGKEYVSDCVCWVKKASLVTIFLESHKHEIALFFQLEKSRKLKAAEREPLIEL